MASRAVSIAGESGTGRESPGCRRRCRSDVSRDVFLQEIATLSRWPWLLWQWQSRCMENRARPVPQGHAALRRGRVSLPNQVYLITFTTHRRKPVFAESCSAMAAARAMTAGCLWQRSRLLAWVLMPDHWHGLVQLGEHEALSALIQRLKANTARNLPAHIARPIWASGFHDHALRKDEELLAAARYLVMNPVRARLARTPREYSYWDAVWV